MSFTVKMGISMVSVLLAMVPIQAETLYQKDGITLAGTSRVVGRGVATCQVSEANHSPEMYERMKINHGQPLNVWRMDFAAYNESGRWLEHLTANFSISAEHPPCTSWTGPDVVYPKTVQWGHSFEFLQRPYGMGPGDEARDTIFVLTFHNHEPVFESWKIDYGFAAGSGQKSKRPAGGTNDGPNEHESLRDASQNPEVPAGSACDLGKWNTFEYFRAATLQDVKSCLAAGADLTTQGGLQAMNPLQHAVSFSNPDVVTALLAAGADPNEKWRSVGGGWTPLYLAFERNEKHQLGVVKALIAGGASVHERSTGTDTALHTAAYHGKTPEVIQVLLDAGANPTDRNEYGVTPTYDAASNENLAVLEALLAAGGTVIDAIHNGRTPLHSAANFNDNPAVTERIIAEGANLEARDSWGRTSLHEAAGYENTAPAIRVLLKAGANLEARDDEGNTPLHRAAAYEGLLGAHAGDAIKTLLEAGANPNARNGKGETPWDVAQANKNLKGTDAYWLLNQARFK